MQGTGGRRTVGLEGEGQGFSTSFCRGKENGIRFRNSFDLQEKGRKRWPPGSSSHSSRAPPRNLVAAFPGPVHFVHLCIVASLASSRDDCNQSLAVRGAQNVFPPPGLLGAKKIKRTTRGFSRGTGPPKKISVSPQAAFAADSKFSSSSLQETWSRGQPPPSTLVFWNTSPLSSRQPAAPFFLPVWRALRLTPPLGRPGMCRISFCGRGRRQKCSHGYGNDLPPLFLKPGDKGLVHQGPELLPGVWFRAFTFGRAK